MKTFYLRYVEIVCILLLVPILFISGSTAIAENMAVATETFDSQLEDLLTTVYCHCGCVRETIRACVCPTAQNIEIDFRGRLLAGGTVDEIRSDYLNLWGPQFSAVMPAKGINLIAYVMPAIILMGIGGVILFVRHQSRGYIKPQKLGDKKISDELQQKVESQLDEYKKQN